MVTSSTVIRIASRGSQLALWQAEWVAEGIRAAHPAIQVEIEIVKTIGDRILDVPLARIGDRGLFTKEVDEALLSGQADVAVHSLKDVPTLIPEGLVLAAVSVREDPRDVIIGRQGSTATLDSLPAGARVGTSSLRRRAQLHHHRPDLDVLDLRGNLNTRLAKLDEGSYDAIILAAAGVIRLGWEDRISEYLDPASWLPAVGQGALAIVARGDDPDVLEVLASLGHAATTDSVAAERAFLRSLEGGCQVPIAALARVEGDALHLDGLVSEIDGTTILRDSLRGDRSRAHELGVELAQRLEARGAATILRNIRMAAAEPGISPP